MKVNVEIITGTFVDTEVSENSTVKELKEKIATEVKLSVKRLILVVGDEDARRMVTDEEDEMKLKDLGVREDSHMYLFFKHPDLVYKEERSQGRGDHASMEEVSSEVESKRGDGEEEEESAKVKPDGGQEENKAMKDEEVNRDVKVEEKRNEDETKDEDEDGKDKAREAAEDGNKMD